jgi:hypothetical protein
MKTAPRISKTEQLHSSSNASDLYLGGSQWGSEAENRLHCLRPFVLLLTPSRKMLGWYLQLDNDHLHSQHHSLNSDFRAVDKGHLIAWIYNML